MWNHNANTQTCRTTAQTRKHVGQLHKHANMWNTCTNTKACRTTTRTHVHMEQLHKHAKTQTQARTRVEHPHTHGHIAPLHRPNTRACRANTQTRKHLHVHMHGGPHHTKAFVPGSSSLVLKDSILQGETVVKRSTYNVPCTVPSRTKPSQACNRFCRLPHHPPHDASPVL
jgi:hypothetical protein